MNYDKLDLEAISREGGQYFHTTATIGGTLSSGPFETVGEAIADRHKKLAYSGMQAAPRNRYAEEKKRFENTWASPDFVAFKAKRLNADLKATAKALQAWGWSA